MATEMSFSERVQRFGLNEERTNTFVNGDATTTWTTSGGAVEPSIRKIISDQTESLQQSIGEVVDGVGYQPPVAYAAGINIDTYTKTVLYNSQVYAPNNQFVPFTTTTTFDPTKFHLVFGDKPSNYKSIADNGALPSTTAGANQTAIATTVGQTSFPFVPKNDYLVNNLNFNSGPEFLGEGRLLKAVTGGTQQLNSKTDYNKYVFGLEYMAAWHQLLINQSVTPTRAPIVAFGGDSTTEGASVDFDYRLTELFKTGMQAESMQSSFGTTIHNVGQSGWNTEQWRTGTFPGLTDGATRGLPLTIVLNPDLVILSLGINDPGYLQDGNPAPADAGDTYPGRRTVADFTTSIRSILTSLRSFKGVGQLSIILAIPNSTSDTPNGRDEKWYELISPVIKQASRDFQCVCVDKYGMFRDSRNAAGVWMDNPYSDGRAIHPLNVLNVQISNVFHNICYPPMLKFKLSKGLMRYVAGFEDVGDASRPPPYYKYGRLTSRALTGFPYDGMAVTEVGPDAIATQYNYPYDGSSKAAWRIGLYKPLLGAGTDVWGPWVYIGYSKANVVASSGYNTGIANPVRVTLDNTTVRIQGGMVKATAGVIAAGTIIGVVPIGFRPAYGSQYGQFAMYFDGATGWEAANIGVDSTGNIIVLVASTISVAQIYFGGGVWDISA